MGFKEPYPGFPYAAPTPPPASIVAIADKVTVKRVEDDELDDQVSAGADDSTVYGTDGYNALDYWNVGLWNNLALSSAFRFSGITIPSGAIITAAYLTFTAYSTRTGQALLTNIYGEKSASPSAYGATEDFTTRDLTTELVVWDATFGWTVNHECNSPDISAIVQELVDAYGGYSDGVMAFQWQSDGMSGADAFVNGYQYDGSTTKAVKLHIEYYALDTLTKKYLFQYTTPEITGTAYFYLGLHAGENPEAIFSINDFPTPDIEFTRLAAKGLKVYYDDVLKTTMPKATDPLTLYDGYYLLHPIPS